METRNDFPQKFDSLSYGIGALQRQTSNVSAGPGQAGGEAILDGIDPDRKHDRYDRRGMLCRADRRATVRDDDIDLEMSLLRRGADGNKSLGGAWLRSS